MIQDLTLVIFVAVIMLAWIYVKNQENDDE